METVACNFHDDSGEIFGEFQLQVILNSQVYSQTKIRLSKRITPYIRLCIRMQFNSSLKERCTFLSSPLKMSWYIFHSPRPNIEHPPIDGLKWTNPLKREKGKVPSNSHKIFFLTFLIPQNSLLFSHRLAMTHVQYDGNVSAVTFHCSQVTWVY